MCAWYFTYGGGLCMIQKKWKIVLCFLASPIIAVVLFWVLPILLLVIPGILLALIAGFLAWWTWAFFAGFIVFQIVRSMLREKNKRDT